MTEIASFQPGWATPPGTTLVDFLAETKQSHAKFSKAIGFGVAEFKQLVSGVAVLDEILAGKLSDATGAPKSFWLSREEQYRSDLVASEKYQKESEEWLSKLPVGDMVRNKWISPQRTNRSKVHHCLNFFDVTSVDEWYKKYNDRLMSAAYRTSTTHNSTPESVATWLRQAELSSKDIECAQWNPEKLNGCLDEIKSLTRVKSPAEFLPVLRTIFSGCGVAFTIVKAPSGCRASGAAAWISSQRALIVQSARYLSDDHFWFTLFHEIGHLLLHKKNHAYIEISGGCVNQEEEEANRFSALTLIPEDYQEELRSLKASEWKKIVRFSKKMNISPGIVVGQLQFLGLVRNDYLNNLKVRYNWT